VCKVQTNWVCQSDVWRIYKNDLDSSLESRYHWKDDRNLNVVAMAVFMYFRHLQHHHKQYDWNTLFRVVPAGVDDNRFIVISQGYQRC